MVYVVHYVTDFRVWESNNQLVKLQIFSAGGLIFGFFYNFL